MANAVKAVQDETRLIDRMMADLLDATDNEADLHLALVAHAEDIRSLAELCEQTGIYAHAEPQFTEFKAHLEESTPPADRLVASWQWLLDRIVTAPTMLHMRGAVRFCIPLVASYLPPVDQAVLIEAVTRAVEILKNPSHIDY
ncbi:hypothetical protein [Pseudomonas sp. 2FE]|uniref:hypothetical protein n=1 Tax=Pseudomonas sp. 2FE TaxID=2502190 RepID=UPI001485BA31|nr:hypothetical protein [Pseudomonas sp. 2FE]